LTQRLEKVYTLKQKEQLGGCKMFAIKEREDIEIYGQVTYTSEIFTFLFWEIEKQTYPERKITIRRRTD
jgi:hypothetical protein